MAMGLFSASGVCAMVFGSQVLDTVLGSTPDRTHPAFIVFMLVMVPGMLIGVCGCFFGVIFPLYLRFHVPLGKSNEAFRPWLHRYATRLADYSKPLHGQPEGSGQPAD
jgi:hypothetical protein